MKEAVRTELNKLKIMNGREKAEYIWEYYRPHMIVFAVIALFVYAALDSTVINPPKKNFLGLALYGPFVADETVEIIESELTGALVPAELTDGSKVYVTNFFLDNMPYDFVTANTEKFFAMCTAQEIDIVIAPPQHFTLLAENEYLLDLSALRGVNFKRDDMLYCAYEASDDDRVHPVGIPLKNAGFLKIDCPGREDWLLGVIINAARVDTAVSAINLILE